MPISAKHLWPLARMDEALKILAQRCGLATKPVSMPAFPAEMANDRVVYRLPAKEIRALLCEPLEAPLLPEIDALLAEAEVPAKNRSQARPIILRERLSDAWIGNCWLVRPPLSQNLSQQARTAKLPGQFVLFLLSYFAYYTLWILSWWLVGKGALEGRLDPGWLIAWLLLLLTLIPFRALARSRRRRA